VSPKDKLRIVKLLKGQDRIVAVTGDGVNDAPALKSAHIGVAMGQMGTDVSKEASELILLDDSYPTLIHAIREGRTIYANLKKTILASMTSNAGELTIVLLGLLFGALLGWPVPILAVQILSIDLLAEILPLTALTFDPGSKTLMTSPPRKKEEHIIMQTDFAEILFFGILMGGLAFFNFSRFNNAELIEGTLRYSQATTVSYLTIAVTQWMNILSRRYPQKTFFDASLWNNQRMIQSIGLSILMVLFVVYVPFMSTFLGFAPIGLGAWMSVLLSGLVFLFTHELLKVYKRSKRRKIIS
jgi:Ca2+-transporting ATPase